MFHNFNSSDFFNGSPTEQLACLNRAVEYVQLSEELERRFMAAVKRMKQAFNLCSSSEKFSDEDKDYIHFYCAVRSILSVICRTRLLYQQSRTLKSVYGKLMNLASLICHSSR